MKFIVFTLKFDRLSGPLYMYVYINVQTASEKPFLNVPSVPLCEISSFYVLESGLGRALILRQSVHLSSCFFFSK